MAYKYVKLSLYHLNDSIIDWGNFSPFYVDIPRRDHSLPDPFRIPCIPSFAVRHFPSYAHTILILTYMYLNSVVEQRTYVLLAKWISLMCAII